MPFQKGHPSYIKKAPPIYRNCIKCGNKMVVTNYQLKMSWGKYCSRKCRAQHHIELFKGNGKHHNFKGDKVTYYGIHDWFLDHLPKPKKCEKCGEKGSLNKGGKWNIQRALIHGKKYERRLENFMSLCQRCHMKYDKTMVKAGWNKGQTWNKKTRNKISKSLKKYYGGRHNS